MMANESREGITISSDRRWALVAEGVVVTVILWNGDTTTFDPAPRQAVELTADDFLVTDGWTYDGEAFTPPEPYTDQPTE